MTIRRVRAGLRILRVDSTWIAVCLSGAFFFLELTIGPIWAIPMDIAPAFSGTASGLMNSGSALAVATAEPARP